MNKQSSIQCCQQKSEDFLVNNWRCFRTSFQGSQRPQVATAIESRDSFSLAGGGRAAHCSASQHAIVINDPAATHSRLDVSNASEVSVKRSCRLDIFWVLNDLLSLGCIIGSMLALAQVTPRKLHAVFYAFAGSSFVQLLDPLYEGCRLLDKDLPAKLQLRALVRVLAVVSLTVEVFILALLSQGSEAGLLYLMFVDNVGVSLGLGLRCLSAFGVLCIGSVLNKVLACLAVVGSLGNTAAIFALSAISRDNLAELLALLVFGVGFFLNVAHRSYVAVGVFQASPS